MTFSLPYTFISNCQNSTGHSIDYKLPGYPHCCGGLNPQESIPQPSICKLAISLFSDSLPFLANGIYVIEESICERKAILICILQLQQKRKAVLEPQVSCFAEQVSHVICAQKSLPIFCFSGSFHAHQPRLG